MPEKNDDSSGTATAPVVRPSVRTAAKNLPPYNVVLLDDDVHTYDYVIEMLHSLFGHPPEKGYVLADEVNRTGRAVVFTTHKERAEFKRDQITGFGMDIRVSACKGSMTSLIEPAEGE